MSELISILLAISFILAIPVSFIDFIFNSNFFKEL